MKRTVAITLALVTLIAAVGVGPAAALGAGDVGTTNAVDAQNETNESDVAPGTQLSAVVGVQESEIEGSIESRAFGHAVANATTNESKAEVVAKQLERNRERLAELQERKQELKEERAAGNISEGQYKAKMAKIAAETASIKQTTNQSANATEGIPTSVLEEQGINASAIQQLQENASELSGGEVAEIAKSIAGERTGQAGGAPDDVGERGEAGDRDETEDAEDSSGDGAGDGAGDDAGDGAGDGTSDGDGSGDGTDDGSGDGDGTSDDGTSDDDTDGTETGTDTSGTDGEDGA
ncbi:DUF7096 domain-containing protein [Haloparvum sp. PAK95]|uniref:DUF7096 domain-containing protein n=1 Tax=Haloparvum sp. PAK95 TaxID=3418962 RepID=UPI003D2F4F96